MICRSRPRSLACCAPTLEHADGFPRRPGPRLFPITIRQLERLFHFYSRRAALGCEYHLYCLRHTALTRAYRLTRDIRMVQELAGHASVTTTQIYTHVDNSRLKAIHKQFHPRQ